MIDNIVWVCSALVVVVPLVHAVIEYAKGLPIKAQKLIDKINRVNSQNLETKDRVLKQFFKEVNLELNRLHQVAIEEKKTITVKSSKVAYEVCDKLKELGYEAYVTSAEDLYHKVIVKWSK